MSLIKKTKQFFKKAAETIIQDAKARPNRSYDYYLIFGPEDELSSPWLKENWKTNFEPYLDLIIKQAPTYRETGIDAITFNKENRTTKKDNKEFVYHSKSKLGKLKWDAKSHDKWTIKSDAESHFLNLKIYTPNWTVCEKRNTSPDIFITISNERDFENVRAVQFGYFIVIAIAKDLMIKSKPIITALSKKIEVKASILKTRKWRNPEKAGHWTFNNEIEDTYSNGIYDNQNLHSINFNELVFEPTWEIIHRNEVAKNELL